METLFKVVGYLALVCCVVIWATGMYEAITDTEVSSGYITITYGFVFLFIVIGLLRSGGK